MNEKVYIVRHKIYKLGGIKMNPKKIWTVAISLVLISNTVILLSHSQFEELDDSVTYAEKKVLDMGSPSSVPRWVDSIEIRVDDVSSQPEIRFRCKMNFSQIDFRKWRIERIAALDILPHNLTYVDGSCCVEGVDESNYRMFYDRESNTIRWLFNFESSAVYPREITIYFNASLNDIKQDSIEVNNFTFRARFRDRAGQGVKDVSDWDTATVRIRLGAPGAPILCYEPKEYDFGAVIKGAIVNTTLDIWNSGEGVLEYKLLALHAAVDVTPRHGHLSAGEHATITVSVNTSRLELGHHEIPLFIYSNGGDGTVSLYIDVMKTGRTIKVLYPNGGEELIIGKPHLVKWAYVLMQGDDPTRFNVRITLHNRHKEWLIGEAKLADEEFSWFIDRNIPVGDGYKIRIELKEDPSVYDLGDGTFSIINLPPTVSIDYPEGGDTVSGLVNIRGIVDDPNGGSLIKVLLRIDEDPWKECGIGLLPLPTSWSYNWDTTKYSDGRHRIEVKAYDGIDYSEVESIEVWVQNENQPQLSYSPSSHDFGTVQEGQIHQTTFEIWNSGSGELTWSLSEDQPWLSCDPLSGESAGEHKTVTVTIDTSGLAPGSYVGEIKISSNGGSGIFTVTFYIAGEINHPPNKPKLISPRNGATDVSTSPTLNVYVIDPDGDSITVYFYGRRQGASSFDLIDSVSNVENDTNVSIVWDGLNYSTTYEWYAIASDNQFENASNVWTFTTEAPPPNYYTLTVDVDPQNSGYVTLSPPGGVYEEDEVVEITAHPYTGYTFSHWSGDATGTDITISVKMDSDKTITAHFSSTPPANHPPYQPTLVSPGNGETGVGTNPTLIVNVIDPDGDLMTVYFYGRKQGTSSFGLIGSVSNVENNTNASIAWNGLDYSTTYEWYAVVSDGEFENTSDIWTFTTEELSPGNNSPYQPELVSPPDGATGVSTSPTLIVNVSDPDGDILDVYFYNAFGDSLIGVDYNVPSGESASIIWEGLDYNTAYYWYAVAYDGKSQARSVTWYFVTESAPSVYYYLSVDVSPDNAGYVYIDPPGDIYGDSIIEFENNTSVTLSAYPYEGYKFVGWSGDISDTNESIQLIIDGNISVVANFESLEENVTLNITKPEPYCLYFRNKKVLPTLLRTWIIGPITIEVNATGNVDHVVFLINKEPKYVDYFEPFNYTWSERAFGRKTISVKAYDASGSLLAEDHINVTVINFNRTGGRNKEYAVVEGTVYDYNKLINKKIPWAKVIAYKLTEEGWKRVDKDRTGRFLFRKGDYKLILEPGYYMINVTARGYDYETRYIELSGGDEKHIDFYLNQTILLKGKVKSKGLFGRGIRGANITAIREDNKIYTAKSGLFGRYRLPLPPGNYTIVIDATSKGYKLYQESIEIKYRIFRDKMRKNFYLEKES